MGYVGIVINVYDKNEIWKKAVLLYYILSKDCLKIRLQSYRVNLRGQAVVTHDFNSSTLEAETETCVELCEFKTRQSQAMVAHTLNPRTRKWYGWAEGEIEGRRRQEFSPLASLPFQSELFFLFPIQSEDLYGQDLPLLAEELEGWKK